MARAINRGEPEIRLEMSYTSPAGLLQKSHSILREKSTRGTGTSGRNQIPHYGTFCTARQIFSQTKSNTGATALISTRSEITFKSTASMQRTQALRTRSRLSLTRKMRSEGLSQKSQDLESSLTGSTFSMGYLHELTLWHKLYASQLGSAVSYSQFADGDYATNYCEEIQRAARINRLQSREAGRLPRSKHPHGGTVGAWSLADSALLCPAPPPSRTAAEITAINLAWALHYTLDMRTLCLIEGGLLKASRRTALKTRKANESRGIARSEVYDNISYQTLVLPDGTKCTGTLCAVPQGMSNGKEVSSAIVPISNRPSDIPVRDSDKAVPSRRDLTVLMLRREVETLRQSEKALLSKLSRCLEAIQAEERFFDLGMQYGQWETLGELNKRRLYLKAMRELIIDPMVTAQLDERQEKALRERMRL
jgi:hypothetical protein